MDPMILPLATYFGQDPDPFFLNKSCEKQEDACGELGKKAGWGRWGAEACDVSCAFGFQGDSARYVCDLEGAFQAGRGKTRGKGASTWRSSGGAPLFGGKKKEEKEEERRKRRSRRSP